MSGLTLVCFAVPQEAARFRSLVRDRKDLRVLITGMGARHAERSARRALDELKPQRVFSCGFAGALDPALKIGDVIFDRETTPEILAEKLKSFHARPASFHCSARIAILVEEKAALRAQMGADAIEMESRVIQELCATRGLECVTLRAISDTAHEDLPLDFNQLLTADEKLSAVRLAWAVLKAPQKIPALIRLGQNSARAARELARVLSAVLPPAKN